MARNVTQKIIAVDTPRLGIPGKTALVVHGGLVDRLRERRGDATSEESPDAGS